MRASLAFKCFLAAAIVLAGIAAYGWYSLQHMQIDASGLAPFLNELSATVEIATLTVPRCASTAEYTPVGDRKQEAMMLYVASMIDFYKTTFGRLPDGTGDLDKLPNFRNAERLNDNKVKAGCSIQRLQSLGAYVVSCGGKMPSPNQLSHQLNDVRGGQRFVALDGTEVLYVPYARECP